MKTNVYLWKHLAEFFTEWETSQTKVVEKIKNTDFMPEIILFSGISCCLGNTVEKYGTVTQATDKNITGRMRFTWWTIKNTDTHPEYVIHIAILR